jgi:hypothetical protein
MCLLVRLTNVLLILDSPQQLLEVPAGVVS